MNSASSLFRPRRFALLRSAGFFDFRPRRVPPLLAIHLMWRLDGSLVGILTGRFAVRVDLHRPGGGIDGIQLEGTEIPAMRLLGVSNVGQARADEFRLCDSYVRGNDLIATYSVAPDDTVLLQITRHILPRDADVPTFGIETVVSMQTNLLDSRPEVNLISILPSVTTIGVGKADSWQHIEAGGPAAEAATITPDDGKSIGLFLFRLPAGRWSYAEMVYPSDFLASDLSLEQIGGGCVHISHRLLDERLEKGVIRRARLRGVFVSSDNDEATARRGFRQFSNSPPPLTT